ncbi:NUDIX domain-containing protein [Metamycoplasma hyosynoviae]|nr:NUDIX domain-containing protein [Metamycoplasma hyosynoviae]MDD1358841.1 NUDIX domain-containing protein [Metamycoplasma hyosynoviae]MDD1379270.1 NUDIX domain-containing protein [Metamycoplasma hyosynoviae]MDD7894180.1 NUDIX domain-containing protein [Metamycoplasma hyosynoviae]UTO25727.1 NUDIX domain-containing protein [Metamycoplasma hyosynoviae]UTO27117.1 NUDIX domain-containing protein [Metamycoplasma hyosynoviae]
MNLVKFKSQNKQIKENNMIKEVSCGAITFSKRKFRLTKVLLIKQKNSHYFTFPKGHQEQGETHEQTAIRELKEETNIDINIIEGFKDKNTYSPYQNCIKDVFYFCAEAKNINLEKQDAEIQKIGWYSIGIAALKLHYKKDKQMLKTAYKVFKNYKKTTK